MTSTSRHDISHCFSSRTVASIPTIANMTPLTTSRTISGNTKMLSFLIMFVAVNHTGCVFSSGSGNVGEGGGARNMKYKPPPIFTGRGGGGGGVHGPLAPHPGSTTGLVKVLDHECPDRSSWK